MTVKSTVLTKKNYNILNLEGKRIIGTIQSGNPSAAVQMYDAWMNVYEEVPVGTPNSIVLSQLGFDQNTINDGVILGQHHIGAISEDFINSNVVVKHEGSPGTYGGVDLGFGTVTLIGDVNKQIDLMITDVSTLTQKTLFFAVTYKCEPTSEHYHVVWAKLMLDPDAVNSVQVTWQLINQ